MSKTLTKFIEKIGDSEAAILLGKPRRTITSWRRKDRYPRPREGTEIVRKTKRHKYGPVTFEGIYKVDK